MEPVEFCIGLMYFVLLSSRTKFTFFYRYLAVSWKWYEIGPWLLSLSVLTAIFQVNLG